MPRRARRNPAGAKEPHLRKIEKEEKPKPCDIYIGDSFHLFINGSSNRQGAGAGVALVSPDGRMLEQSICLEFKASNNEVEYEALIKRLKLATTMEADEVVVFCDSQLIVNQAADEYATRDERMIAYVKEVVRLLVLFQDFWLQQVSRDDNSHADVDALVAQNHFALFYMTLVAQNHPQFRMESIEGNEFI